MPARGVVAIDGAALELKLARQWKPPVVIDRSPAARAKTAAHIESMVVSRIKPVLLPPGAVKRLPSVDRRRPVSANGITKRIDAQVFRGGITDSNRRNSATAHQSPSERIIGSRPQSACANSSSRRNVLASSIGIVRPQSAGTDFRRIQMKSLETLEPTAETLPVDFDAEDTPFDKTESELMDNEIDRMCTIMQRVLDHSEEDTTDRPMAVMDDIPEYNITDGMRERIKSEQERLDALYAKQIAYHTMRFASPTTIRSTRPSSAPAMEHKYPLHVSRRSSIISHVIKINNSTDPAVRTALNKATLAAFFKSHAFHVLRMRACDRTPDDVASLAAHLRSISAFAKLSDFMLKQLCSSMAYDEFLDRQVVFEQGDNGGAWYVILKGSVKVNIKNAGNDPVTVAVIHAGEGFGELALIHHQPRSATIVTDAHCIFARVEKSDYVRVFTAVNLLTLARFA
jgi:hypothetical protein